MRSGAPRRKRRLPGLALRSPLTHQKPCLNQKAPIHPRPGDLQVRMLAAAAPRLEKGAEKGGEKAAESAEEAAVDAAGGPDARRGRKPGGNGGADRSGGRPGQQKAPATRPPRWTQAPLGQWRRAGTIRIGASNARGGCRRCRARGLASVLARRSLAFHPLPSCRSRKGVSLAVRHRGPHLRKQVPGNIRL